MRSPRTSPILATACDLHAGATVERDALIVAWLQALRPRSSTPSTASSIGAGARSATIGRRVRVEHCTNEFVGTATRLTEEGYLVVTTDAGDLEQTVTAGDVIHLRPDRTGGRNHHRLAKSRRFAWSRVEVVEGLRSSLVGERGREPVR